MATQNERTAQLNQVWVQLSQEHQAGVIQLMAQLVLKLIIEQFENSGKEADHEQNQG